MLCHRLFSGFLLCPILILAACSEDPARAGFFGGLSNMASGTYDQRQKALEETLQDTQDQQVQKQRELERVQLQQSAVQRQYRDLEQHYAAVNRDVVRLRKSLQTKTKNKEKAAILARKLNHIEQETRLLQSGVQDYESQERLLQQKTRDLNLISQEMDNLLAGR